MAVEIGRVPTFAEPRAGKAQGAKVCEEAAELLAEMQNLEDGRGSLEAVKAEAADVVQAVCNGLAALGVRDMRPSMSKCAVGNVERGRRYEFSRTGTLRSVEARKAAVLERLTLVEDQLNAAQDCERAGDVRDLCTEAVADVMALRLELRSLLDVRSL